MLRCLQLLQDIQMVTEQFACIEQCMRCHHACAVHVSLPVSKGHRAQTIGQTKKEIWRVPKPAFHMHAAQAGGVYHDTLAFSAWAVVVC